MTLQQIHFVRTECTPVLPPPANWFDGIRWQLVKWLGGENPHETVKVERVIFDSDDFMRRIFAQEREIVGRFNRHPKQLLIGAEDFEQLMHTLPFLGVMHFRTSYHTVDRIHGLEVTVVPWMRGILVMP